MGYTVFRWGEHDWQPRREGDPRLAAGLSDGMTNARANVFRYPPGSVGRRHIDPVQEEVFVVVDGTLTIHMGGDGSVVQHALEQGDVLVGHPATALQLSNRHDGELRLFIIGAPPEQGDTTFLDPVE